MTGIVLFFSLTVLSLFNLLAQDNIDMRTLSLETKSDHFKVVASDSVSFIAVHVESKSVYIRRHDFNGEILEESRYTQILPFDTDEKSFSLRVKTNSNTANIFIYDQLQSKYGNVIMLSVNLEDIHDMNTNVFTAPVKKSGKVNVGVYEFDMNGFTIVSRSQASKGTTMIYAERFTYDLKSIHSLRKEINLKQRDMTINGVVSSTENIHVYYSDYSKEKLESLFDVSLDGIEEYDIGEDRLSNIDIFGLNNGIAFVVRQYDARPGAIVAFDYKKRSIRIEKVKQKNWEVIQSSQKVLIDSSNYTARKSNLAKLHNGELEGAMANSPSGFKLNGIIVLDSNIHVLFNHGNLYPNAYPSFGTNISSINFSSNLEYSGQNNFIKSTWHKLTTQRQHDYCTRIIEGKIFIYYLDKKGKGLFEGLVNSQEEPEKLIHSEDLNESGFNMEMSSVIGNKVFIPITDKENKLVVINR